MKDLASFDLRIEFYAKSQPVGQPTRSGFLMSGRNKRKRIFLLGLFLGGLVFNFLYPSKFFSYEFIGSTWKIILAGLLVGFGTRLANGCTSGHGVCGISRISIRSIIATITFIVTGVAIVALEGVI